jgi:acyl-CoA synthetase (AMP-forming)/AMP-acid ligase II/acyl carrier protein
MKVSPHHVLSPLYELSVNDPNRKILTFVDDQGQDAVTRTVSEFVKRVDQLATYLQDGCGLKKGDVALLIYPPSMEFIEAFAACLVTGIIAAPVYPPNLARPENDLVRLNAVSESSGAKAILTNRAYRWAARMSHAKEKISRGGAQWPQLPWYVTQGLGWFRSKPSRETNHDINDVAILQFTSGSTSIPKGVRLTHKNLIHQLNFNAKALKMGTESRFVMWVPQYHDLGLISGIISTLCGNGSLWCMSPLSFLRRPSLWMETMHRVRATHTASPNFGYELVTRKTTPEQRAGWDLSHLEVMMSAAEPIVPSTVERFFTAFKTSGISEKVFCPAYGLAEHTVGVTVNGRNRVKIDRKALIHQQIAQLSSESGDLEVIGCGSTSFDIKMRVVCPNSLTVLEDSQAGEVWVQSDSVADGYEGLDELTQSTFRNTLPNEAGFWLKTGDIGFIYDGELFITGRKKDLIILAGRNYHPEDLEEVVRKSHPSIRPGGGAAFSIPGESTEKLVVVVEVLDSTPSTYPEVVAAVRKKIFETWQVQATIGLLPPKSVKKTTSGKLQRTACRQAWLDCQFDLLEMAEAPIQVVQAAVSGRPLKTQLSEIRIEDRVESLVQMIRDLAKEKIPGDFSSIGMDDYLPDSGLDSMASAELIMILEETLQHRLPASLFVEHPTLRSAGMRVLSELGIEHYGAETQVRELEPMSFRPKHRGMSPAQTRIGIVGGGVGGLVSAYELAKLGYKNIVIFESAGQCGGKVRTEVHEGILIELGQMYLGDSFQVILRLAREMNCEIELKGTDLSIWDEEFGYEEGPSRSSNRRWLQSVIRAAKLTVDSPLPFPSMTEGLDQPFVEFIKSHGLYPPPPFFKFDWNAMGYGLDWEAPASYVLSYVQLLASFTTSCALKNGNQELWTKLAQNLESQWGVQIDYHSCVENVNSDSERVTLFVNGKEHLFDEVIFAVAPSVLEKILPTQDPLQEIVSQFEYYGYSVFSFKSKDFIKNGTVFLPQFTDQKVKPMVIGSVPVQSGWGWYMSGHMSSSHSNQIDPISHDEIRKDLSETVQLMGGKVESFGPEQTWVYFPHLRKNSSQMLRFAERLQGTRHLWTTGSWMSFETTEHVARHAQHLIQTCFDPSELHE